MIERLISVGLSNTEDNCDTRTIMENWAEIMPNGTIYPHKSYFNSSLLHDSSTKSTFINNYVEHFNGCSSHIADSEFRKSQYIDTVLKNFKREC